MWMVRVFLSLPVAYVFSFSTEQDIPKHLDSLDIFPGLQTLSLFTSVHYHSEWTAMFLPIIVGFHSCSPSLRHIRIYAQTWMDKCTYEMLLRSEVFGDFATDVKGLQNIDTIVFSLWYMYDYSSEASNEELALLADMFRPVRSSAYHGGRLGRLGHEWPFFKDDFPENITLS
ncbi:hypothetical protein DL96DRAFT_1610210 [Flagelloscypha sp. PMI_526]|nr:hypothetical protein DL96DRAFT_1610210 [Flagelloscypha sp. PMI_526]